MRMTLHVVQHTSAEFLGLIEDHLEGRGIRFRYSARSRPAAGCPSPRPMRDGLVLLGGGPWGSAGGRDVPTLAAGDRARARLPRAGKAGRLASGWARRSSRSRRAGASEPAPLEFEVGDARRVGADALEGYPAERISAGVYMRDWPVPPADARDPGATTQPAAGAVAGRDAAPSASRAIRD